MTYEPHTCPFCELRFDYHNEVKDHILYGHRDHLAMAATVEIHDPPRLNTRLRPGRHHGSVRARCGVSPNGTDLFVDNAYLQPVQMTTANPRHRPAIATIIVHVAVTAATRNFAPVIAAVVPRERGSPARRAEAGGSSAP
jgi:hypothetical protein